MDRPHRCQNRSHYRSTGVDALSPRCKRFGAGGSAPEPQWKGYAHRKRKRDDEQRGDGDPGWIGWGYQQPEQGGEEGEVEQGPLPAAQ
jgi:hypothetical protein